MAISLGFNQYGKAEVRLVHVDRSTPVHQIKDVSVTSQLLGDFAQTHLTGDNGAVIPTDTQKNTAYALAGHPRIGERCAHASSRREQSGVAGAGAQVLDALAAGNRAYEERFGHVYLVCANGRPAGELLAVLRGRLGNDPATERRVLRAELREINRLRLERLLEEA